MTLGVGSPFMKKLDIWEIVWDNLFDSNHMVCHLQGGPKNQL